jgi:rod shape-determining protein MreC
MRNLLNFLDRYTNFILLLLFEVISIYLIATSSSYHNSRIINGVRGMTGIFEKQITNIREYLNLYKINKDLAAENSSLRNKIEQLTKKENLLFFSVSDTLYKQQYVYTAGKVINNSVNKQKNFFTLNKGTKQGVNIDMAVTSPDGIAGIIVGTSDNYSITMSLLSIDFRLSCRIRSRGYFGSLIWDGKSYRYAELNEIPNHVFLNRGDTVETTGYSAIFPEGMMVGKVDDFEKTGGDFYKIKVILATDFRKLNYVTIIGNLKRTELKNLEKPYR